LRTVLALYALAFVVRILLIAGFPDPAYPDSFYYVDVARALARGEGFHVDVIWIFAEVGGRLPADPVLPIASNAHWMPLASLIQVPFIWVLGPTAVASALPFAITGATAAPLAWAIARDAKATPAVALGAGILTAIPGLSLVYMVQPDNFSLYQPLVAGALWMTARGLRGSARSFLLAGLLAGVATLSRNDGVLVLGVIVVAYGWDRWRYWRAIRPGQAGWTERPIQRPLSIAALGGAVALFLVAVGPWYLRQLTTFGSISPTAGRSLFIRDIGEWNSITAPGTLDYFLGQGVGSLLSSRIGGLIAAAMIFSVLVGALVLIPFLLVGAWSRRRSVDFGPFFLYAAALFAFSAIVSAVHVPGGTFIHSAVALAPHGYILALEGIAVAVAWIAQRRPIWRVPTATRLFTTAAIVFTIGAAAFGALSVHGTWDGRRDRMVAVANALEAAGVPAEARLMSIDAAGYRYHAGRAGVVLVDDPIDTIHEVARAYDIDWLVLERDDGVDAVGPVLDGHLPQWLGQPIVISAGTAPGTVDAGLYPVLPGGTVTLTLAGIRP
jgi:hypothetical protein